MCLLPLVFGVCLASPSELSFSADVSRQVAGEFAYWSGGKNYHGGTVGETRLQMDVPVSHSLTFHYAYIHTSLIDTSGDRGQERLSIGFVFRPFGGAR